MPFVRIAKLGLEFFLISFYFSFILFYLGTSIRFWHDNIVILPHNCHTVCHVSHMTYDTVIVMVTWSHGHREHGRIFKNNDII